MKKKQLIKEKEELQKSLAFFIIMFGEDANGK